MGIIFFQSELLCHHDFTDGLKRVDREFVARSDAGEIVERDEQK